MALAQYSELFWVPSGAVAASIPARVFLHSTNTLATLYADGAGTTPLANPTTTSNTGRLEFYAEEGPYWVHIDSEAFEIAVGAAAQPATQQDIADEVTRADAAYAPLVHAARHAAAGADPLTLTQAQITGLAAALAALAPLDGATFTGAVTVDGAGITIVDGQLVLDSSGTAINAVDRGATSNFAAYVLRTGGVDRWSWQMINDATNDLLLTDSANGVNIIRVVPHPTTPTTTISGVAAAGSKNGLTGIRLAGFKDSAGAPSSGTWTAGDVVLDSAGAWHLCTAGGTPGTWT